MGPMSYEGSENYIFISYAHRDSEQVMQVLEKLVESGYRVWYDDGIAPGSEWPEDIAQHLDGCAVFLAFISNNSMASANCRREITFAMSRKKPFLGIVMEPTNMSLGMEMQLSAQQCILRYNFRKEEDFLRKIYSSPDLKCCKIPDPEPVSKPAPEPVAQIAAQPVASAPMPEKTAVKPFAGVKKKVGPSGAKKPKKGLWIAGAAVAAVIALIILLTAGSQVSILPDVKVNRDTATVTLDGKQVTSEAVEKISSLTELSSLNLYNCTLDAGALDALSLPGLQYLTIKNTPVSDFGFLENYPQLYSLILDNCGLKDRNLPGEAPGSLKNLTITNCPEFSNLACFPADQLRSLKLDSTAVADIRCLQTASDLMELSICNTQVTNVDALAGLEHLRTLRCAGCAISQISPPFLSLSMTVLDFGNCGLKTTDAFQNLTILQQVNLSGNQLEDISWLAKSADTLEILRLADNPVDAADLAFLKDTSKLTLLDVSGIPLTDAVLFAPLTSLTTLYASRCGLEDITQLKDLVNLKVLYLDQNQLTDLTGLPPMDSQQYPCLNLAYNQITDPSPITGQKFYVLALQGNPIDYSSTAFANAQGTLLTLDYSEGMLSSGTLGFTVVCVSGCPLDRKLDLEDIDGANFTSVTEEALLEKLADYDIFYSSDEK